ncbi:hypothetical protein [Virgisporangium aurantiacum]|uniref:Uncharacterized protein n=1 Tax=Virgisporangium aurantiacum TaxID=175570 RepID=A0A8J3Z7E3_9ACTN|nr:hypothetical protein [Virgisporangium aurantiacum]GIJ57708.1 hypothetical protein Vau01_052240 [Virgisporangium aurantiacum]
MVSSPAAVVAGRYSVASAMAAISVAGLWHLANDLLGIIAYWDNYRSPAAAYRSLAVWLAYTAVGVIAAVLMLRRTRSVAVSATGIIVILAGTFVVAQACGPNAYFTTANWTWGTFGWFALLLLWQRPLTVLIAALTANSAVVLAAMAAAGQIHRVELAQWGMVLVGTALIQVILAVGARLLEHDAHRTAEAAAAADDVATRALAARIAHRERRRRYHDTARAAMELIAGLASGTLDPSSAALRRRAGLEAARLRRLLAEHDDVPDPLLHELRAAADLATRRGVAVDFVSVGTMPDLPPSVRRDLGEVPLRLLAMTANDARVTVAATPEEVSVGVVVELDSDAEVDVDGAALHSGIVANSHREGTRVWANLVWHG